MRRDRSDFAALAATAALVCVIYILTFRAGTHWGDDFAQYIQHAANIVSGRPYAALPYDYDPAFLRPRVYPPGFPLLWAISCAVFGLSLTAMKVVTTLCFAGALVLVGVLTRDMLSLRSRLLLIVLVAANPLYWDFKDAVLTDWPFFALSMAVLVMTHWLTEGGATARREWIAALGAGAAMAAAIAIRTHAVVLVPVFVAAVVLRRRRVTLPLVLAAAVPTLVAAVLFVSLPLLETYAEIGGTVGQRFTASLMFYAKGVSLIWDNGRSVGVRAAFFALTSLLALAGIVSLRSRLMIPALFVAGYLFVLIAFGGWEGFRYLIPVLPFYVVCVLAGIERAGRARPIVAAALLAAVMTGAVASHVSMYATMNLRGPMDTARPAIIELWRVLRARTAEDAIVQFGLVRVGTLYSGRRGSQVLDAEPDDAKWRRLGRAGTTHLTFIASIDGAGAAAFLERNQHCMTPVFANTEAGLFELKSPAERARLGCQ